MSDLLNENFRNASFRNFSLAEDRAAFKKAIEVVENKLGRFYRLKDGAAVATKTSKFKESWNPANPSQMVGGVEYADQQDAQNALEFLASGRALWQKVDLRERVKKTEFLANWMEARRDELSAWMVLEAGKSWKEADADTCEAIDFCRYYAREMLRLGVPRLTQKLQGENNHLVYRPRGISLVIAPWNFPLAILAGMTVASLVTGNSVILKPAEQTSVIAALLAQGLKESGFPEESFYFLPGIGEEIGPLLVQDERIDLIIFTGSANVGLSIIEEAAKKPKPHQKGVKKVIAEMGGKNAMIVDDDADLDEAITGAISSAFGFQGQKCSALSRLLVHENVYDSFVSRFVEAAKSLRAGDPRQPEFQVGPVIDEEAQGRIEKTIHEASKRLKTLYIQEKSVSLRGYYVPLAIFEVEDENDFIFQNEIFGPVVAIKKVKSLDEAIRSANNVRFALTGGIYSRNPSHIERVKEEMEVGNLYINRGVTGAIVERQPFGGYKLSGVGSKAGGPDYLIQLMEPRTITENTVRRGFAAS
jgi:RHH-type proline utilization regulon transcriptional repressor/proline dehydrogenase/delta 1-pyrroline-5-carboxylate dehydrogenase